MGVSDLRELAALEDVSFDDLDGSTVAVDFHNWLYRYLTTVTRYGDAEAYTTADGTEVPNLLGIAKGLPKFYEHDLEPVFVFDGDVLALKEAEVKRRSERKAELRAELAAAEADGDQLRMRKLRARTQELTPTVLETSRELLSLLDVPVVDAPAEAEAQAAHMGRRGDVDYVCTEDYDALLFGAPLTLRRLTSGDDLELMDARATLAELGLSRAELVDVAILCGTDYNDGVHGVGPKTALEEIGGGTSLESVLAERDAEVPSLAAIRSQFLDPTVSESVSYEPVGDPDLAAARSYLVDTWEVPEASIDRAFRRLDDSIVT